MAGLLSASNGGQEPKDRKMGFLAFHPREGWCGSRETQRYKQTFPAPATERTSGEFLSNLSFSNMAAASH